MPGVIGAFAPMMSLTPMSPSAWRCYVEEIAKGREDYFAKGAERSGQFVGRGSEALRVHGAQADALSLERLFGHGTDPRDGSPLGRSFDPDNERAVAGFALTFSPPKSGFDPPREAPEREIPPRS